MTQDEEIKRAVAHYKDMGVQLYRDPHRFTFGDKASCLELLKKVMTVTDGSITILKETDELRKVAEWMSDTQGKGLAMIGTVGSGKTTMLRCIPVLFAMKKLPLIRYIDARQMAQEKDMNRWYCIDDVGTEPTRNNFGERSEAFADIVCTSDNYLNPLCFTTNLSLQQITNRYDQRILDRIAGRCRIIEFKSASMR